VARPRTDIRPRIIAAARERYLSQGVDGASLRAIAADAGTNIGMIYYYFPTKDDLFLAVVEDVYVGLLEDIETIAASEGSMEDRTRRLMGRLASLSEVEFAVLRIVIREALVSNERLGKIAERFSRGHLPPLISMVMGGVANGELTDRVPPPVLLAALGSLTILPQVVRRRIEEQLPQIAAILPPRDAMIDALVSVLMHGIAKSAADRD
jgi:AcrR family transcriptional regulator